MIIIFRKNAVTYSSNKLIDLLYSFKITTFIKTTSYHIANYDKAYGVNRVTLFKIIEFLNQTL